MNTIVFTAKLACPHCQESKKLYPAGTHLIGKGKWEICSYIAKLLKDNSDMKLVKVVRDIDTAMRSVQRLRNKNIYAAFAHESAISAYAILRK